jgi:3-methyladenine DNA glycosylase AlkD
MTKTKRPLVNEIEKTVRVQMNPQRGTFLQRFFKTAKGEYGEGDIFWGLSVPQVRSIAKIYQRAIQLDDIGQLLNHEVHEMRLLALIMLVQMYKKAAEAEQTAIFEFYLRHTDRINNWDLVDLSAAEIVGTHILTHPNKQARVTLLQDSQKIWERRISIIALFPFVKQGEFELPIKHLTYLVNDSHDLIQKAVGWVLRAMGDNNIQLLRNFLDQQAATMPRTALRYAIEHLAPIERQKYLQLKKTKESHVRHSIHP